MSDFYRALLARHGGRPKQPYQPRVLITANDYRRAGMQGPPSHLAREQAVIVEQETTETEPN